MPTYEYACTECGNRVEVIQRIDEQPPAVCELCGGTLRKVFHPAGIVFKGSGFYATDSRTKAKSKSKGGADGDGKAEGAATKKKEESKASPAPEKPA
ncbi:MAG: FmdB family zinc ribbon protein [Actinomycetota bacterium]